MSDRLIAHIESQLDELIERYRRLEAQHDELRQKEQAWTHDRAQLVEKHEAARTRVEAMITRLKQIEASV